MASYIVADEEITNPDEFQKYAQQVGPTLNKFGGKVLARTQPETLEGNWKSKRIVILEFPSAELAKGWYQSPEYSAIKGIRQRAATASFVLVPGL